jgi:ParB family transcriptional regulator, chromosome partitioning protein
MAEEQGRTRLGRGLAALIGDMAGETKSAERADAQQPPRNQRKVPIEFLRANPNNPRKAFSDTELAELAESIRERGIIQPIVVRSRGPNNYEIIAGERRWRASQRCGLHEVPIVVIEATDGEALELAIIENVQRSDLNPLEEASGYLALADQYGHSQEEIAKFVGKSRSHVANMMRLLHLPEQIKAYINEGKLTAGHARMLVGQPNALEFAEQIVKKDLNVRQVEAWARRSGQEQVRDIKRTGQFGKDPDTEALEVALTNKLGLAVTIEHRAKGGGVLQVRYHTLEQLDDVMARLEQTPKSAVVPVMPRVRGL